MRSRLRVLFLAAEADPFFKVGGLGDVAGSLPPVLRQMGVDIRLALPLHGGIQLQEYPLQEVGKIQLPSQEGSIPAHVFLMELAASSMTGSPPQSLPIYFIAGELISPDSPVYSNDADADGLKYTFFSLAALKLSRSMNWAPDVLHANDWHTSLAVYALYNNRKSDPFFSATTSVLGIHNLPYLGAGVEADMLRFNLPLADTEALPAWARGLPMPLGLLTADRIVTVSPSYAQEILTPEYSSGLDDLLCMRAPIISGILNGLDTQRWNPETDKALMTNYNSQNLEARCANKTALQVELGLKEDARSPLLAMISRMDHQKGVDLLPEALHRLSEQSNGDARDWQVVILGTGDPVLEATVHELEYDYPSRVRVITRFDTPLSHRIYAGADILLVPSRYEPCGMTQMIAMRYGCVPIARATGGLRDTVRDIQQGSDSTGFLFEEPTPMGLFAVLDRALRVYQNESVWKTLQLRGMQRDFSWERSAQEYLNLYQAMVRDVRKIKRA